MQKKHDKFVLMPVLAWLLSACAAHPEPSDEANNQDAINDFIEVAELEQVDAIRSFTHFNSRIISDHYVIIYDNKRSFLVTYKSTCRELRRSVVKPDVRFERTTIRAKFDTIRGCKIDALHKVSDGQVKELMRLGQQAHQSST